MLPSAIYSGRCAAGSSPMALPGVCVTTSMVWNASCACLQTQVTETKVVCRKTVSMLGARGEVQRSGLLRRGDTHGENCQLRVPPSVV